MVDAGYTANDHGFRENDDYARAKYDITLRWLGVPEPSSRHLLNIGCGSGVFNALAHDAGFEVEACEPDPAAHAVAAATAAPGVVVHGGGLFDAALGSNADVVVMHDVLEHIEDDRAAMVRVSSLLAPGGTLVMSVPAMPSLYGSHDEMLGHYRRYDRATLTAVVESTLRIDALRSFGMLFIPVTAWYSCWRRARYPTGAVGRPSLVGRAFRAACTLESHVALPIGTSLLVRATKPGRVQQRDLRP